MAAKMAVYYKKYNKIFPDNAWTTRINKEKKL